MVPLGVVSLWYLSGNKKYRNALDCQFGCLSELRDRLYYCIPWDQL